MCLLCLLYLDKYLESHFQNRTQSRGQSHPILKMLPSLESGNVLINILFYPCEKCPYFHHRNVQPVKIIVNIF